jgi:hypothetical protein
MKANKRAALLISREVHALDVLFVFEQLKALGLEFVSVLGADVCPAKAAAGLEPAFARDKHLLSRHHDGMDQPKRLNGVGKFFQLLVIQLLPLPLPAIDIDGVDFDRVEFAGCHIGTRTIVDGFGDETVRHRASFQTQILKAGGVSALYRRSARAGRQALNKPFETRSSYAC